VWLKAISKMRAENRPGTVQKDAEDAWVQDREEQQRPEVSGSRRYGGQAGKPVLQSGLVRAETRAIGAERARAHASRQAGRRKWRRHVAQCSAAIAALRDVILGDAEPVAAGVTFRIDALNSPAGQILHGLPPSLFAGTAGKRARASARNSGCDGKRWADNAPQSGGCQEGMPQYVVADSRPPKDRKEKKEKRKQASQLKPVDSFLFSLHAEERSFGPQKMRPSG
jgi:hypothetical protein